MLSTKIPRKEIGKTGKIETKKISMMPSRLKLKFEN
jgi:hypothetical protein